MIGCMKWCNRNRIAGVCVIFLAGLPIVPTLRAGTAVPKPIASQSTPELKIRVYGFRTIRVGWSARQKTIEAAAELARRDRI